MRWRIPAANWKRQWRKPEAGNHVHRFKVGDRVIFKKPPDNYAVKVLYKEGDHGTVMRNFGPIVVVRNDYDGREWATHTHQLDPEPEDFPHAAN